MIDYRTSDTEAGRAIREVFDEAEKIVDEILKSNCIEISRFMNFVQQKIPGASQESALDYLSMHLPGKDKMELVNRYTDLVKDSIAELDVR